MQSVTSLKVTLYEHRSLIKVNSFFPSDSSCCSITDFCHHSYRPAIRRTHTALNSPAELNKLHPGFEAKSLLFYDQTLFNSPELSNYRLLPHFAGESAAAELPAEIRSLLKLGKRIQPLVGAYPSEL